MQEQVIDVLTTVPAFLGAADQSAEWRTPAFKALLREWWRVRMSRSYGYDHEKLREAEGVIFGHAALRAGRRTWACRSRVVLTLDEWRPGRLESWTRDSSFPHPVEKRQVQSQLYLAYGPLNYDPNQGETVLKRNRAIDEREVNHLRIWCPDDFRATLDEILHLAHLLGAVGGRSRNGWGSIQLAREGSLLPGFGSNEAWKLLDAMGRPLRECLRLPFAHALGEDASGRMLLWRTRRATGSWQEAIKSLAEAKVDYRTKLRLRSGEFSERHLLGLPVPKKDRSKEKVRLGSQLRFKVVRTRHGYHGIAFHLPCGVPPSLESGWSVDRQAEVWEKVHRVLDEKLVRIEKGDSQLLGSERLADLPRPAAPSVRRDEPPKPRHPGRASERRRDAHDARTPPVRRELAAEGVRHGQRIRVVVRARTDGKPGWQAEHQGKRYTLTVTGPVEWQDGDQVEVGVIVTAMGKIEFRWTPPASPRGGPQRRR